MGRSIVLLAGVVLGSVLLASPVPAPLPDATRAQLLQQAELLRRDVQKWPDRMKSPDLAADAAVFARAVVWALNYDQTFSEAHAALLPRLLERGQRRLEGLRGAAPSWTTRQGRVARGFFSAIDGSAQPYGMVIPASYDGKRPMRLDVVLHGSRRPEGIVEATFLEQFDDTAGAMPPPADYLELHPLGRVENCYRWAGETDVFEAIEAACRNYNVDRNRIVLRGMSMGGSGTWHLGLKHPDRFAALGPYCGYVDTHQFSLTPMPYFPKVGPLPWHQERALRIYDAKDWAANAGMVPVVAAMGEKDIFFDAHVLMARAMKREGLELVNLISPGTGHTVDPVTHREQMKRIADHLDRRSERAPQRVHFTTWTLRYSRCHWLEILGLREHYARADIDGIMEDDGGLDFHEPVNVTRFAILTDRLPRPVRRIRIHGHRVPAPDPILHKRIVVALEDGAWQLVDEKAPLVSRRKSPGLQGPIDDAFTGPFLCVRGTGTPWNVGVKTWSDRALDRFAADWRRYFRGDCPVKDDKDVTEEDVKSKHLILFGDPGSNPWIARVLPELPFGWTKELLTVGEQSHPAANYAPALIHPNPLNAGRYVVLNSGHTFRGQDINYLMFPRWGDWAVVHIGGKPAADVLAEEVVRAGFFDEDWKVVPEANGS